MARPGAGRLPAATDCRYPPPRPRHRGPRVAPHEDEAEETPRSRTSRAGSADRRPGGQAAAWRTRPACSRRNRRSESEEQHQQVARPGQRRRAADREQERGRELGQRETTRGTVVGREQRRVCAAIDRDEQIEEHCELVEDVRPASAAPARATAAVMAMTASAPIVAIPEEAGRVRHDDVDQESLEGDRRGSAPSGRIAVTSAPLIATSSRQDPQRHAVTDVVQDARDGPWMRLSSGAGGRKDKDRECRRRTSVAISIGTMSWRWSPRPCRKSERSPNATCWNMYKRYVAPDHDDGGDQPPRAAAANVPRRTRNSTNPGEPRAVRRWRA